MTLLFLSLYHNIRWLMLEWYNCNAKWTIKLQSWTKQHYSLLSNCMVNGSIVCEIYQNLMSVYGQYWLFRFDMGPNFRVNILASWIMIPTSWIRISVVVWWHLQSFPVWFTVFVTRTGNMFLKPPLLITLTVSISPRAHETYTRAVTVPDECLTYTPTTLNSTPLLKVL